MTPATSIKKREKYFYITGRPITKKQWKEFADRWGIQGDVIKEGKTTIAYRRVRELTEQEQVYLSGKY
jgi:hypothetical protein